MRCIALNRWQPRSLLHDTARQKRNPQKMATLNDHDFIAVLDSKNECPLRGPCVSLVLTVLRSYVAARSPGRSAKLVQTKLALDLYLSRRTILSNACPNSRSAHLPNMQTAGKWPPSLSLSENFRHRPQIPRLALGKWTCIKPTFIIAIISPIPHMVSLLFSRTGIS